MSNFITYLFIGFLWMALLDLLSYIFKTEVQLSVGEKLVTSLLWPFTFIIFMYHFIKANGNGNR